MGIMLVGLAISTPIALFWVLFHIMAHSLTKASLFFSPPFPIFFSEFFILLQLGAVSLWVLSVMLVLLFIAATGLGYFVLTTFTRESEPDSSSDMEPYRTPASMKGPIIFLLVLLFVVGIFLPTSGMVFLNQIVTELRF
ncbi:MAG: hypothetical protein NTZ37_09795 [Methanoregula sp.]|nr:hypothetical protein [Methanoregula sp.]